ncbi:Maf family protein [Blautia luti]|uniref:dTTP/UTP pyrophosphatase n=1 Tax=Blautia luti DSM 14534 = JCM 17040 TaxID=649762 RepID=A0A844GRS5_9FIRM|nr:Maf family protein [Blautia luti]MTD62415.1 septum formation inhibitor Maf [Blautia luti DSM 14534 = JCM 17040]BEI59828.1 Maf family protein [Blautia luti]
MSKIILASASPRRKELLAKAGISFTVIPAAGEEKRTSENPGEAVQQLARDKAEWVAQSLAECEEGTLVIGSDTIVVFENRILGKPKDRRDAAETLEKLQGNTHQVYTGVSVLERKAGKWVEHTFFESTDVTFYPVSREEIQDYIATGEPMDKAGSYGIQGLFGIYVKGICGDYNNVVGLPVARLFHEMKKSGINLRG